MKLTNWLNDTENMTWQAAMRFSMVVLSSLLFGMYYGQSLPPEFGQVCRSFALCGLAFYFSLELVADQRVNKLVHVSRKVAEERLSRRVPCQDRLASSHESAKSDERKSGSVESAMDSSADLAVYLGPTTQPILSV